MMTLPDDATLVRYVLGTLPVGEAERFDELSISDGEFADRVRAIEHDLADAYARGELTPDERARWAELYLASEAGQEDLRFARAFAAAASRAGVAGSEDRVPSREPADHTRRLVYGLAAAAVVILAVAAAILMTRPVRRATPPDEAEQRPQASPTAPSPSAGPPRFVALTLTAPRRDLSETPTLRVPAGTDEARLTLRLEPNDFDRFNVDVREASTNRLVWQTAHVATRDKDGRSITIAVPIRVLRAGRFVIQLGSAVGGAGEIVGEYSLKVVFES